MGAGASVPDDALSESDKAEIVTKLKHSLNQKTAEVDRRSSLNDHQKNVHIFNHMKQELESTVSKRVSTDPPKATQTASARNSGVAARKPSAPSAAAAAAVTSGETAKASARHKSLSNNASKRQSSEGRASTTAAAAASSAAAAVAATAAALSAAAKPAAAVAAAAAAEAPAAAATQAKFRKRRLTYAAQHAQSSNQLPIEQQGSVTFRAQELGEEARGVEPPLPPATLGIFSCHGMEPSWQENEEGPATAKINQDRGCITYPFMGSPTAALLCVFDGHGENGDAVSNFAMTEMPVRLSGHPDIVKDPAKALKSCFLAINKALRSLPNNAAIYSGSTAVVALVRDGKMWVANAGDSRAILVVEGGAEGQAVKGTHPPMRVVPLTTDHDPDLPTEKARIVASGGFVSAPAEPGLSARVWLDPEHTQIGLAMARSLGDLAVKTVGVIAEPEVLEHTIQPTDRFMVMASDGVWEFLTSTDVAAFAHEHLAKGGNAAAKSACEALIARAANMWRAHEGQYRDDITAQILMLPCFGTSSSSA